MDEQDVLMKHFSGLNTSGTFRNLHTFIQRFDTENFPITGKAVRANLGLNTWTGGLN